MVVQCAYTNAQNR